MTPRPARLTRLAIAGTVTAVGLLLGGCGNSAALGLARQACGHVTRSVDLYTRSLREPPSSARADQANAESQLRAALPQAAIAAAQEPQWQALMTTIGEASRVPEADLVQALTDQCQVADSPGGLGGQQNPDTAPTTAPTSTAPPATKPTR